MSENETDTPAATALGPGAREAVDGDLSKPFVPEDVDPAATLPTPAPTPPSGAGTGTGPKTEGGGTPPPTPAAPGGAEPKTEKSP